MSEKERDFKWEKRQKDYHAREFLKAKIDWRAQEVDYKKWCEGMDRIFGEKTPAYMKKAERKGNG